MTFTTESCLFLLMKSEPGKCLPVYRGEESSNDTDTETLGNFKKKIILKKGHRYWQRDLPTECWTYLHRQRMGVAWTVPLVPLVCNIYPVHMDEYSPKKSSSLIDIKSSPHPLRIKENMHQYHGSEPCHVGYCHAAWFWLLTDCWLTVLRCYEYLQECSTFLFVQL